MNWEDVLGMEVLVHFLLLEQASEEALFWTCLGGQLMPFIREDSWV